LFANNHKEVQQTDIILTLTPHIVRVLDLTEADLKPFRLGRDAGTPALEPAGPSTTPRVELPPPAGAQPGEQPPGAPPFYPTSAPAATPPQTPFPQPLQGPMPGTPLPITLPTPPKKPGGGGGSDGRP
jgi:general secretion pathway protein D